MQYKLSDALAGTLRIMYEGSINFTVASSTSFSRLKKEVTYTVTSINMEYVCKTSSSSVKKLCPENHKAERTVGSLIARAHVHDGKITVPALL